ncbi:hypothetical protein IKE82_01720 [Candidatus Saccharibacteria bacterium]|nr:hypothetical protein [Candidatus Saccharibacteria bacterium]
MRSKKMSNGTLSRKNGQCEGFTLVELSLSMVFISTLSLAVVMVITGAISSYHKSITMNQVNTVGTELVDDMRLSVQQSSSTKLSNMCEKVYDGGNAECANDKARHFVSVARITSVRIKGSEVVAQERIPVFGAFCTGTYSYIWNSGYFFDDNYEVGVGRASLKYNNKTDNNVNLSDFKLLKIKDEDRAVCIAAIRIQNGIITNNYTNDNIASQFDIARKGILQENEVIRVDEEPAELIGGGEDGLALYDLSTMISEQTGAGKNIFYYTSFVLGTVQGGINVNANGGFCAAPEEYNSEVEASFDYCAINKFNFAALANGG